MQLLMEKPAFGGRANPAVLANIFNKPDFIASLPSIQANRKAERNFALELGQRVFGHPIAAPSNEDPKNAIPRTAEVESPFKALTARMNLSPDLARWLLTSERLLLSAITVGNKRHAHRLSGLKLKKGPLSERLGGEYIYRSALSTIADPCCTPAPLARAIPVDIPDGVAKSPSVRELVKELTRPCIIIDCVEKPHGRIDARRYRVPERRHHAGRIRAWRVPA